MDTMLNPAVHFHLHSNTSLNEIFRILSRELQQFFCTWHPLQTEGIQHITFLMLTSLCTDALLAICAQTFSPQADRKLAVSQNSCVTCRCLDSYKNEHFNIIFYSCVYILTNGLSHLMLQLPLELEKILQSLNAKFILIKFHSICCAWILQ